jgi:hypothetical protein
MHEHGGTSTAYAPNYGDWPASGVLALVRKVGYVVKRGVAPRPRSATYRELYNSVLREIQYCGACRLQATWLTIHRTDAGEPFRAALCAEDTR